MSILNFVSYKDQAVQKITAEKKKVSGQREKAMSDAVFQVVHDFCLQSESFAKAVVDGGTFSECMSAVAKGIGSHISDLDAYKKAVKFYLPKADIRVQMSIILPDTQPVAADEQLAGGFTFDLLDFL